MHVSMDSPHRVKDRAAMGGRAEPVFTRPEFRSAGGEGDASFGQGSRRGRLGNGGNGSGKWPSAPVTFFLAAILRSGTDERAEAKGQATTGKGYTPHKRMSTGASRGNMSAAGVDGLGKQIFWRLWCD